MLKTLAKRGTLSLLGSRTAAVLPRRARSLATVAVGDSPSTSPNSIFAPLDTFTRRHVGPRSADIDAMLASVGYDSLEAFVADAVPSNIRIEETINDEAIPPLSESELLARAKELGSQNKLFKSWIGMGYHNAVTPPVILRNITENPAWYTSYTPYQPEISQGRLESLLNYQTMVSSLTGMDIANASLLDEATAAAEGMVLAFGNARGSKRTFVVDNGVLPQTLAVLHTRAKGLNINVVKGDVKQLLENNEIRDDLVGALFQYPNIDGAIENYSSLVDDIHSLKGLVVCATDLLALTMLKPPGEFGADICVGNSARFGVPLGYGGPHAAFFACSDALKRKMPGRLIGVSKDSDGKIAYRLALQTREQHIRRDKATSNICTAQALLANMAAMYAVYHGPQGLRQIAAKVHALTRVLKAGIEREGYVVKNKDSFFDTLTIEVASAEATHASALANGVNLRRIDEHTLGVTLDESATERDILTLMEIFSQSRAQRGLEASQAAKDLTRPQVLEEIALNMNLNRDTLPTLEIVSEKEMQRTSKYLQHDTFNKHQSETELLRYIYHLQNKDLSLVHNMIPLGSCTMKLNSTSSMIPFTQPEWANVHPFVPIDQAQGYSKMIRELEDDLAAITGFSATSLQPNSGAQGEFAGLSVIKAYHESRGDGEKRNICLIPISAHGTNPASAVLAGMKVVPIKTLKDGRLDLEDLNAKAVQHRDNLAAFMVTYPSTFGVFEEGVQDACKIVHDNGGQVYLDGANLNAQVGLTNPATCGGDVCHLNLHKTFSIPHGGGGPGVGPICVAEHLVNFLPGHPLSPHGTSSSLTPISAAPQGSASILTISWAYIKMLGGKGLTDSSMLALLNANYIKSRLEKHFNVRFVNSKDKVAHELLLDLANFEEVGLKVMDFAKRLQDFGVHPPTCSWPITSAMLIEPTESENKETLDRFIDALIHIKGEADDIASGKADRNNNVIKNAPHSQASVAWSDEKWNASRPYSRQEAVYPLPYLYESKFWPAVGRVDDAYGDRNLTCSCPSVEEMAE
ncbi:glycine dehydrogenase [Wallemia mellicola]|nr:glycine dehydrogenase [Wallemia mellicola]